jgi:polysaccharide biosynthesis transport protein
MADHNNLPARLDPGMVSPGPIIPQAQASPFGHEPEGPGSFSPKRLWRAVVRYRWLVLALAVAGSVAAIFASRHMELSYTAESRLWIELSARGDGLRGPIQSPELLRNEAWLDLLRSFAVLMPVAQAERLYLRSTERDADVLASLDIDPQRLVPDTYTLRYSQRDGSLELRSLDGRVVHEARNGQTIGTPVGLEWQPAFDGTGDRTVTFTVISLPEAAGHLNRRLNARLARGGNFMWISYTASDPRHAARIANAVSERYVELAAELKRAKLDELRDILERQMRFAEGNLRDAEMAFEQFRVATITLPTDAPLAAGVEETRGTVMSAFFDLKFERERLQRDRAAVQRALTGRDGLSVDALSAIESVRQSPELMQALSELTAKRAERRALLMQYTEDYQPVVQVTQDIAELERGSVPALAQRLVTQLGQQMADIDGRVASSSSELREIPARVIDQARYRREVATAENMFNDLRQRYEGARLASETTVPDVRVLDAAIPPRSPSMDQRLRLLLAGLAGSLALGLVLAVGLDQMDPRLRYAEQVTDGMGLMVIGAVPNLNPPRRLGRSGNGKAVTQHPQGNPQAIEALRAVRLNLMHAYGAAGPMIVTVTSPGAGDGKTFMTANLALSYADLGKRTLVIDGDTRRGCMHRMFAAERKPGLTEYLRGEAELGDIVRSTSYPLVDVIPCGTRLPNTPELLSSPLLGDLLAAVRADYDTILIDSPPLGAGVDPLVLGTLAGNLLLVMRTGNTERSIAEAKLRMLNRLPIRVLGTVLNGLDSDDSYQYYSYMPGYEAGEGDAEEQPALLQRG